MGIGAAIIGSAIVGAGATALASGNSSSAARNAAQVQADAANNSAQIQQGIYNQTRNDLAPFRQLGTAAIGNLAGLLQGGIGGGAQIGVGSSGAPTINMVQNPDGSYSPSPDTAPNGLAPITAPQNPALGTLQQFSPGGPGSQTANLAGMIPASGVSANPTTQGLINLTPGAVPGGNPLVNALGTYVPGAGPSVSPVTQGLLNLTPGALPNANPLISNIGGFVPGLGPQNASSIALSGLTPGGNNPLLGQMNALLGVGGDPASVQAALAATPGYQFTLDQGLRSVQNSYAAKGLGQSGAALKGAADYATGLANSTYEQRLQDYLTNYNSQFTNAYNANNANFTNNLNAYSNLFANSLNANNSLFNNNLNTYNNLFTNSLNANAQQFGNALNLNNSNFTNAFNLYGQQLGLINNLLSLGANSGAQVGNIGQQTGQSVGNTLTGGAAAQAGGIVGAANAGSNALTGIAGNLGNAAVTAAMYQNNPLSLGGTSNQIGRQIFG